MADFYCKHPCDNCPFTAGTDAARSETTASLTRVCVEYDIPFMCHKTMVRAKVGDFMGDPVYENYPTKVCAGWIAARGTTIG